MAWLQTVTDAEALMVDAGSTSTLQSKSALHPQLSVALTSMACEPAVGQKTLSAVLSPATGAASIVHAMATGKAAVITSTSSINTESAHTSSAEIAESSGLA